MRVPWTDPGRPKLEQRTTNFHPWVAKGAPVVLKSVQSGRKGTKQKLKGHQNGFAEGPRVVKIVPKVASRVPKSKAKNVKKTL